MASRPPQCFIIIEKPQYPAHITPGSICYRHKYTPITTRTRQPKKVSVYPVDALTALSYDLEVDLLRELSGDEAELLQAVESKAERLKWMADRHALQAAQQLAVDTAVTVYRDGEKLQGIIRFIGSLTEPTFSSPLSGRFFGIELQDKDKGKGSSDGSHNYKKFFSCQQHCGIFVPFSQIIPVALSSTPPPAAEAYAHPNTEELFVGDRVTYFTTNKLRHGMVMDIQEKDGQTMVRISTDTDENGMMGGEIEVPLNQLAKGEVPSEQESKVDSPPMEQEEDLYTDTSLGTLVELTLDAKKMYATVRWIGNLPGIRETMAGLELEEEKGVVDGSFKGVRYFDCLPRRAMFVKLSACRPDSRFTSTAANHDFEMDLSTAGRLETVPPVSAEQVHQVLIGRMRGIQGHCNSCYMDAALFSLFSCTSVLDSMLFKSTEPQDIPIQRTLLHQIVNPLRSEGFVRGQHIMNLRQQLQRNGYSNSFTTDEKDPEEFLTVIMQHILALEPLLKLSAAGKVQESYCYQIFLEQNNNLLLPTVQQLLEHSFYHAGLKLAEVPSCLILQMPRFGKKFKMFEKIVPSLELDITDLLSEGPQECILCGKLAEEECTDCFTEPVFSSAGFKFFCKTCSAQVHDHSQRRAHHRAPVSVPQGYLGHKTSHPVSRDKLELFAVLCIETSHYVSFVKYGPRSQDWIFFDSMADRAGESDGFNIPEVHACPEVSTYLEMSPTELAAQVPRDMRGVAKRLFCDAYMYLYQSTNICLYR